MFAPGRTRVPQPDELRTRTLQIVAAYQSLLREKRWAEWAELWADDATLEFPFAPPGRQRAYHGKAEIVRYMREAAGRITIDSVDGIRLFPMQDPEVAVVELAIKGRATATNRAYDQCYVIFFETKRGKLSHYREYWNPLISIAAFGPGWASEFGSPERDAAR
jgi:uncharacterized protein